MNKCFTPRSFIAGLAFILLALGPSAAAPADGPEKNANGNGNATAAPSDFLTDFSRGPDAFPHFLQPYKERPIAPVVIENSRRLRDLIRDGKLELSLADALALALENNLDIGVQRYVIPLAKADVLRARSGQAARGFSGAFVPGGLSAGAIGAGVSGDSGARGVGSAGGITGGGGAVTIGPSGTFDPSVTFNFSWDRVTSPLNTLQVAGIPTVTTYATALSGTYSQLLPTGTSYFLGINALRQSSTQQFLRFNPAVISRFALGFHQPILNGFGTLSNGRFVLVARNNQKVSEEVFRFQVVNTVVRVQNIYWDMAAFQENVKVAEQSLSVAEKLLRDNQIRSDIGTMAPLDVLSAESEVAARQRDLIVSRTNLQLQEATLKNILTKKSDPELENVRIVTTDPLPEVRDADVDMQNALATAYENRPDLRQAETNLANQQIAERFTENNLKPSFAVFGMYAGSGLQGNTVSATGGASDSLRQSFVGDFPELAGGTTINIPLRNRAAQADDIRAQLERNQLEIGLQRLRNQIGLEVRQAGIGLLQGKAQVGAANQAVILARQTLEGEQKKLAEGVSTSYQEILRARDLVSAQLAAVQARAAYAKALVEMERAMGTSLERNGIQLNDALTGTVTNMPTPAFQLGGGRKVSR
jgi:outer membrane protein